MYISSDTPGTLQVVTGQQERDLEVTETCVSLEEIINNRWKTRQERQKTRKRRKKRAMVVVVQLQGG